MLTFPDRYFEPEVRDGFYVPGKMKRFWASQLEVLAEVDRICRKYDITYFAEWGTLLGAVRHHGFIPWDDDLDISMKREDYARFIAIAPNELREGCTIINYETVEDYWDVMSRVVNSGCVSFDEQFMADYHDSPYISGVDIFPLDYLPREEEQQRLLKDIATLVKTVADTSAAGKIPPAELELLLEQIETCTGCTIYREQPLRKQLYDILTAVYAMYSAEEADNLVTIALFIDNDNKGYAKEYYDNCIYMPFENMEIPVPAGYNSILSRKYGNYMRLVKNGGASTHDYPLYKIQEKEVMEASGMEFAGYSYTPALLDIRRRPNSRKHLREASLGTLQTLLQITDRLQTALSAQNLPDASDMLMQCQNTAISLGNAVETGAYAYETIVKEIENYCELLYQVYEALSEQLTFDPVDVCALLREQLAVGENMIKQQLQAKRIVVFLPFREDVWSSFDALWQKEKATPNTEVYVVPIPYFYRDYFGNFTKGVFCGDKLPAKLHPVSYEAFDFEKIHPDTIYIQNPYDDCAAVTSVLPDFYARNLLPNTDELVYVPYFTTDEIDWTNPRETDLMEDYVTVPGVILADKVLVQSEEMRSSYVRKLTEWAGNETKEIWEHKIQVNDVPISTQEDHIGWDSPAVPEQWKAVYFADGLSNKKTILYSVSVSFLLENKERAIEKIERSFDVFREHKDSILLVFRPQTKLLENLKRIDAEAYRRFRHLLTAYTEENLGIYDDAPDETLALSLCDAYYGDAGETAQKAFMLKKPVMIQNVEC